MDMKIGSYIWDFGDLWRFYGIVFFLHITETRLAYSDTRYPALHWTYDFLKTE